MLILFRVFSRQRIEDERRRKPGDPFPLITNRNYFGVEEILDGRDCVKEPVRQAFHILPELVGWAGDPRPGAPIAPDEDVRLG